MLSIIISILQRHHRSQGWKKHYLIMLDCKCRIEFSHIEYMRNIFYKGKSLSLLQPKGQERTRNWSWEAHWLAGNIAAVIGKTIWVSSAPHHICETPLYINLVLSHSIPFANVFFLVLGSSVICWASPYLQTSPCGLALCRAVYVSITDCDAMVISKGCFIIDAN